MTDYPCAKIGDLGLSRFGQTDKITESQMRMIAIRQRQSLQLDIRRGEFTGNLKYGASGWSPFVNFRHVHDFGKVGLKLTKRSDKRTVCIAVTMTHAR